MSNYIKDPAAVLDYKFDWSAWLDGDTISSHNVTAPAGITIDSTSATTSEVTAWVSGGTSGSTYVLDCTVSTAAGRTDSRKMTINVTDL